MNLDKVTGKSSWIEYLALHCLLVMYCPWDVLSTHPDPPQKGPQLSSSAADDTFIIIEGLESIPEPARKFTAATVYNRNSLYKRL